MAQTFQIPLRPLFSFSKPSRHCRFTNAIPSFGPFRLPKPRTGFRVFAESGSNPEDFGLISASEHSDGSFVFRFGSAKDKEALVAVTSIDAEKKVKDGDDDDDDERTKTSSKKVKVRPKRKRRSNNARVSEEVKTVVDGSCSSVESVSDNGVSELAVASKDDLSHSKSSISIGENSVNDDKGVYEEDTDGVYGDEVVISSELEPSLNVSDDSGSLDSDVTSILTEPPAELSLDEETLGSLDSDVTSIFTEPPTELSLYEETFGSLDSDVTSILTEPPTELSLEEEILDVGLPNNSTEILVETYLEEETNVTASDEIVTTASDEIVTTAPIEALVETPRVSNGNETSIQLGHNTASSTNEVQVEEIIEVVDTVEETEDEVVIVEEIKDEVDIAEELPVSEPLEPPTVEETPNSEEISTSESEEIAAVEFVLSSGASLLRHPSEEFAGGEDAYFVTSRNWLGVADGVGQWSLQGIGAGIYPQELMENCKRIVSDCEGVPVTNPSEVLVRSVADTESSGSSTILVAHFDGQAFHVASVGDSGFVIVRDGSVIQKSSPTVHEFYFQLHVEKGEDRSELIQAHKIDLDEGDVIITATDGLFDNLYDQEIATLVLAALEAGLETQAIAESLAGKAQEVALSSSTQTPFSDAAQAAGYEGYSGGKLDNVAVIVSLVQKKA